MYVYIHTYTCEYIAARLLQANRPRAYCPSRVYIHNMRVCVGVWVGGWVGGGVGVGMYICAIFLCAIFFSMRRTGCVSRSITPNASYTSSLRPHTLGA